MTNIIKDFPCLNVNFKKLGVRLSPDSVLHVATASTPPLSSNLSASHINLMLQDTLNGHED